MPRPIGLRSWSVIEPTASELLSPSEVLARAIEALDVDPRHVTDLFVGCSTPVGAQASGLGRFAVAATAWGASVAAVTCDGGLLASLHALRAARDRALASDAAYVLAAGVEVSSIVPRGAATVRDYGRPPGPAVPEIHLAEQLAASLGLTAEALASEVARFGGAGDGGRPLLAADGLVTAGGLAPEVDAAAVCVLGPEVPERPSLLAVELAAGAIDDLVVGAVVAAERVLRMLGCELADFARVLVVDDLAVSTHAVLDAFAVSPALRQDAGFCFVHGSAAGADALRAVALVARLLPPGERALIVVRGPLGQGGAAVVAGAARR